MPYATYTIIGLNVLVWVGCMVVGVDAFRDVIIRSLGLVPARFAWYTAFTSLFVHDVPWPFHLVFNMLFLWVFGRDVEDALGPLLFVAVYLTSGVAAHAANVLMAARISELAIQIPTIGASGAIAGVMGFYAVRFYQTRTVLLLGIGIPPFVGYAWRALVPSISAVAIWLGWELVSWRMALSLSPESAGGVAHWAHIGGLVFGALTALALGMRGEAEEMYTKENAYDFFREGDWRRAATCFEDLVRQEPHNADAYLKLAVCFDLLGWPAPRAVRNYQRALELYFDSSEPDMALDVFEKLSRRHRAPRLSPQQYVQVARRFIENREHNEAAGALESLAEAHPRSPEAEWALLECGKLYVRYVNWPGRALQLFDFLRTRRPNSPYAAELGPWIAAAQAQAAQRAETQGQETQL